MEVTDDYFRMLQAVVINQVLQLQHSILQGTTVNVFTFKAFHFQS